MSGHVEGGWTFRVTYDTYTGSRGAHLFNDKAAARKFASKYADRYPEIQEATRSREGDFRWTAGR